MSEQDQESTLGGFFKAVKGMIVEDEPKRSRPAPPGNTKQDKSAEQTTPLIAGKQSAMADNLMALVLSRPTAYTAFTEAMAPLEEILPDEATRYKAAFAGIRKSRSLEQVVQSIDMQHLEALEIEVTRFHTQAKNQETTEITSRLNESEALARRTEQAKSEISRLNEAHKARVSEIEEKISTDSMRLKDLEKEVSDKRSSIASITAEFDAASSHVKLTLAANKAKILKHLS